MTTKRLPPSVKLKSVWTSLSTNGLKKWRVGIAVRHGHDLEGLWADRLHYLHPHSKQRVHTGNYYLLSESGYGGWEFGRFSDYVTHMSPFGFTGKASPLRKGQAPGGPGDVSQLKHCWEVLWHYRTNRLHTTLTNSGWRHWKMPWQNLHSTAMRRRSLRYWLTVRRTHQRPALMMRNQSSRMSQSRAHPCPLRSWSTWRRKGRGNLRNFKSRKCHPRTTLAEWLRRHLSRLRRKKDARKGCISAWQQRAPPGNQSGQMWSSLVLPSVSYQCRGWRQALKSTTSISDKPKWKWHTKEKEQLAYTRRLPTPESERVSELTAFRHPSYQRLPLRIRWSSWTAGSMHCSFAFRVICRPAEEVCITETPLQEMTLGGGAIPESHIENTCPNASEIFLPTFPTVETAEKVLEEAMASRKVKLCWNFTFFFHRKGIKKFQSLFTFHIFLEKHVVFIHIYLKMFKNNRAV